MGRETQNENGTGREIRSVDVGRKDITGPHEDVTHEVYVRNEENKVIRVAEVGSEEDARAVLETASIAPGVDGEIVAVDQDEPELITDGGVETGTDVDEIDMSEWNDAGPDEFEVGQSIVIQYRPFDDGLGQATTKTAWGVITRKNKVTYAGWVLCISTGQGDLRATFGRCGAPKWLTEGADGRTGEPVAMEFTPKALDP